MERCAGFQMELPERGRPVHIKRPHRDRPEARKIMDGSNSEWQRLAFLRGKTQCETAAFQPIGLYTGGFVRVSVWVQVTFMAVSGSRFRCWCVVSSRFVAFYSVNWKHILYDIVCFFSAHTAPRHTQNTKNKHIYNILCNMYSKYKNGKGTIGETIVFNSIPSSPLLPPSLIHIPLHRKLYGHVTLCSSITLYCWKLPIHHKTFCTFV